MSLVGKRVLPFQLAKEVIEIYGPDTDKPSVHLAKEVVRLTHRLNELTFWANDPQVKNAK